VECHRDDGGLKKEGGITNAVAILGKELEAVVSWKLDNLMNRRTDTHQSPHEHPPVPGVKPFADASLPSGFDGVVWCADQPVHQAVNPPHANKSPGTFFLSLLFFSSLGLDSMLPIESRLVLL